MGMVRVVGKEKHNGSSETFREGQRDTIRRVTGAGGIIHGHPPLLDREQHGCCRPPLLKQNGWAAGGKY